MGIDSGRTPSWYKCGDEGDGNEQTSCRNKCRWVERLNGEEHRRQQMRRRNHANESNDSPSSHWRDAALNHESHDAPWCRAERQPNADFEPSLNNRIGTP